MIGSITLFLCGDVMLGRGIDQVLPHPGEAGLHEQFVHSAKDYVAFAEQLNGAIPRPVDFSYVWGHALAELDRVRPRVLIINLETSVTTSREYVPKGINYQMNPANIGYLTAAGVDCCVLANNHVLDFRRPGLLETLETLKKAGTNTAGAGQNKPVVPEAGAGSQHASIARPPERGTVSMLPTGGAIAFGLMILGGAAQAISRNKMRSALTMLGVFIGVAALIVMVAVGDGASEAVRKQIESLGTNMVVILPGQSRQAASPAAPAAPAR